VAHALPDKETIPVSQGKAEQYLQPAKFSDSCSMRIKPRSASKFYLSLYDHV